MGADGERSGSGNGKRPRPGLDPGWEPPAKAREERRPRGVGEEMGVTVGVGRERQSAAPGSSRAPPRPPSSSSSSSDSSDTDDQHPLTSHQKPEELSAYERKRLKNIEENAKFFASLHLLQTAEKLRQIGKAKSRKRQIKPKRENPATNSGARRSLRLLRLSLAGTPIIEPAEEPNTSLEKGTAGKTLPACLMHPSLLQQKMSDVQRVQQLELTEYKLKLNKMTIRLNQVIKMSTSRMCSITIHPSADKVLIAAGSRNGQIGLWDLNSPSDKQAVHLFKPHINPINCLYFNPYNSDGLLSLSNNESILCGNLTKGVFHEVYKVNYLSMSSFDFLNEDGATLIVSHWNEYVSLVDQRTPRTGPELVANLKMERFKMVNVHPTERQYFIATGERAVNIYDVRYLKVKSKKVACLEDHLTNINSAYFSPVTGSRVLTTCSDGMIRVFDIKGMANKIPRKTIMRCNNFAEHRQTEFRAVWDPQQEHYFVAGSTVWPRQIKVFHSNGAEVHAFKDPDCLGSICLINAMHPTRNILVGGNSSGKVHVFMD